MKLLPPSRTFLFCFVILAGSVILSFLLSVSYWASRDADEVKSYYSGMIRFSRYDLMLKSVAIKRYARDKGHLPASLEECEAYSVATRDWAEWLLANSKKSETEQWDILDEMDQYSFIDEPWFSMSFLHSLRYKMEDPSGGKPSLPPVDLDLFGFPVIYTPGVNPDDKELWIDGSTPFPDEIAGYFKDTGRIPRNGQGEFGLTSLFLKESMLQVREKETRKTFINFLVVIFLIGLVFAVMFILTRYRRSDPGKKNPAATIGSLIVGFLIFVFGFFTTFATCYVRTFFISSDLSREKRLLLLDKAEKKGEIPAAVAEKARTFINGLEWK
jgi:hypothetical protein